MGSTRQITHGPATSWNAYTAVLSQAGIDAPTAQVIDNQLGGNPVWARPAGAGVYTMTLTGAFDLNGFTWAQVQIAGGATAVSCTVTVTSANVITFNFFDIAGAAVDLVGSAFVEVRLY